MSKAYLERLEASFNRGQAMVEQFIERCPDDLWVKTAAGYPVWLQYYHLMACLELLLMGKDDKPANQLYPLEALMMANVPEKVLSKTEILEYNNRLKAYLASHLSSLTDESLLLPHEGAAVRLGKPMTNMDMLEMVNSHVFYHLGIFDAILREQGLKGIY